MNPYSMRKCQDEGTAKGKKLSTEVRIDADTIYCDDYLSVVMRPYTRHSDGILTQTCVIRDIIQ